MAEFSYHRDHKLRIVVAADLSPGQQLAQSVHAAIEYQHEHKNSAINWHNVSNSVVCMCCDDLEALLTRADAKGISYSVFREPDMDNRLTAVAFEPTAGSRKLTSNLKLALRSLAV